MSAGQPRTRPVDKGKFKVFLNKAAEFHRGMLAAQQSGDRSLACLNAIHCAISCADAVCTCFLGEKSAGQSHDDAAWLLEKTNAPGAAEKAKQFRDIVRFKSLVEYEEGEPSEAEAARMVLQAARIFEWAKQMLSEKG